MAATLHWVDYVIFVGFLVASLGIGVYHCLVGGWQRTTQEFIMANRNLHVLPTMMSLLASYQSAIMILGNTAEMYNWGIQTWIVGSIANCLSIVVAERLFVPWIYPLKLTSTYEYFVLRFKSRAVAMLASGIGVLKATFYMGTAIYAPSLALESACGLKASISIPLMSLICTVYTALGGMKAVIWTDVFQCIVMLVGMLAILIRGILVVGGFGPIFDHAGEEGRLNYFELLGLTFWTFLFGSVPMWSMIYGLQQASVQRYSATQSLKDARLTLLLNLPASLVMSAIASFTGLTVLAYFSAIKCDPMENGDVTSGNQILVHFVTIIFDSVKGFSGLFLVTLYSGALSSVSSSLSGSAANMWECILKYLLPPMSDQKATLLNKILVVIFGFAATGIAFLASEMSGPVTQVATTFGGAVGGPLFAMFLLGGMFSSTEWIGCLVGALLGLIMNLWVGIGSRLVPPVNHPMPPVPTDGCDSWLNVTSNASTVPAVAMTSYFVNSTVPQHGVHQLSGIESFYSMSYLWYLPLGTLTSLAAGFTVSQIVRLLSKEKMNEPEAKYLISWKAVFTFGESNKSDTPYDYHLASSSEKMPGHFQDMEKSI